MKKVIILLLMFIATAGGCIFSCGMTAKHDTTPSFSTDIRCENWQAKQISRHPGDRDARPSQVAYFRREFSLDEVPVRAILHLSADMLFKLYVTGTFVGDGPPRTCLHGTPAYYCSYDVTSLLIKGENVLALEVYFPGYHQPWLTRRGIPVQWQQVTGQLEFYNSRGKLSGMVTTDSAWKTLASSWFIIEYTATGPGYSSAEVFDAVSEPEGWKSSGYDDSDWETVEASPAPELEASMIPHYVRNRRLPGNVEFTGEVTSFLFPEKWAPAGLQMAMEIPLESRHTKVINVEGLLQAGSGAAIIENDVNAGDQAQFDSYWDRHDDMPMLKAATIILDFGEIANAFVEIDIEGVAGTVVDIGWGQMLVDGRVHTMPRFFLNVERFNKYMTYASRYYLRDGRQQWETYHWQNFRYLQLTVRNQQGPVKLHRVAAIQSGQPLKERGSFESSDPFLDKLFVSSGKTLEAASYDFFMDNTSREKEPWGGDIADGSVSNCLSVFGDIPMLRYYIELFIKSQGVIGTGMLPQMATRTGPLLGHFSHSLRTATWMAEYGFWCNIPGDYKDRILPSLEWYLEYLDSRVDERGLLKLNWENNWVDHVIREKTDISVPINLLYVNLLNRAAVIVLAYGKPDHASAYREKAGKIRDVIYHDYWDEQNGLYLDGSLNGEPCENFSTHANYLALLCGLGRDGRKEIILRSLSDPGRTGDLIQFGPPFFLWPPASLAAVNENKAALDMIRELYSRFFRNTDGGDTFWEESSWALRLNTWVPAYRSLAQNGGGSPAWFMLTEVLGVKPLNVKFARFEVDPQPGDLSWAKGVVPSPAGNIMVSFDVQDSLYTLTLDVPEGTVAEVVLPGKGEVRVNEKPLSRSRLRIQQTESDRRVACPPGSYNFSINQ